MSNIRKDVRRKLLGQINLLDTVKLNLLDLAPIYGKDHPEIAEQLKVMHMLAEQLQSLMSAFRDTY